MNIMWEAIAYHRYPVRGGAFHLDAKCANSVDDNFKAGMEA
jgi:hypothetical protein